jgi:hypothetical protein
MPLFEEDGLPPQATIETVDTQTFFNWTNPEGNVKELLVRTANGPKINPNGGPVRMFDAFSLTTRTVVTLIGTTVIVPRPDLVIQRRS